MVEWFTVRYTHRQLKYIDVAPSRVNPPSTLRGARHLWQAVCVTVCWFLGGNVMRVKSPDRITDSVRLDIAGQ